MKYLINILIFLFAFPFELFTSAGCSSSTGPVTSTPGRRDYTWTVDTLNIPYTMLGYIWGSSPTDVWAVGPGGDLDKTIYHFTGEKWYNDGISRSLTPGAVFGFSPNDVWFGSEGSFWHYNGTSLSRFQDYSIPDYPIAGIQGIWGDSPNNIYAVGYASDRNDVFRGVIHHFNGLQWATVYLSPLVTTYQNLGKIYKDASSGSKYYVLGYYGSNHDTSKIYEYTGNKLNEIYASPWFLGKQAEIALINNEVYFLLGSQVCTRHNDSFQTLFNSPGTSFLLEIGGRNMNDILLFTSDGIAHYNGNDIQYLYNFNHTEIYSYCAPAIFDKEVFFLAYDFQNKLNLIIRGKLK